MLTQDNVRTREQVYEHEMLVPPFLDYLETGTAAPGLFAADVVASIHVPGGHYDIGRPAGLEAELKQYGGPIMTTVLRQETIASGFIVEFTQRSPRGELFEEMAWALVEDGRIREIRWYCTGVVREA